MPLTGFYFQAQNVAQWHCKRLRAFRLGQLGMAKDKCCCNFARNDKNGKGCCLGQRQLQCKRKNWPAEGHKNQWISFFFSVVQASYQKAAPKIVLQKLHLRYAIKCHAYLALAVLFALVCEQRADGPGRKERKSPLRHKIRLLTLLKRTRAGSLGSGAFDSGAQIGKPADDWLWAGQQADASACYSVRSRLVFNTKMRKL